MPKPVGLRFARLYPIVDLRPGRLREAVELARIVAGAGAPWLQLRAKTLPDGELLDVARTVVGLARQAGTRVIVNDRCDVARLVGAAGVHLGQDDLPIADARRLLAPGAIVGVSTHDAAEAMQAERDGADYVGFGAIYATGSKPDARSPRGPGAIALVRAAIRLPIVAIGGIDEARAPEVLAAGADAFATIGALESSPDPAALVRRWADAAA